MPRPPKERRVEYIPEVKFFKPAGIPMRDMATISLTIEEIEAIRLKDSEGLTQQEASEKMEVSRPTFQRVLTAARQKIAEALIQGKAIKFEGGDYRLAKLHYHCSYCDSEFELPYRGRHGRGRRRQHRVSCPSCGRKVTKKSANENR